MNETDTVKLLRECDAGIKMGVASIDDVLDYASQQQFRDRLVHCKTEHEKLKEDIKALLAEHNDKGKEPNPMAKGMTWMKSNVKIAVEHSDATIADLMTDGCNMGVKSLRRYLNQYSAADEKSKDIAKKLIDLEKQLVEDIRQYL